MSPNYAATLCAQLESILDAGAPNRQLVKQLKGIEQAFRSDAGLNADVIKRMNQAIENIRDFWTALQIPMGGRELDAVRYVARCSIHALESAVRRALPQPPRRVHRHAGYGATAHPR